MAIHEHIFLHGHVLTLREFFEIITGKTLREFRSESEVATRYEFDEAHELETWFEKLKYGSLDDSNGCRFFDGILPKKLELFELSASQCEDAHLPAGSVAIGYVFYRTDQFTPVYPLELLRVTPEVVKLSEQLRMAVPHERLRVYLGSSASPPSVIMVIDECNCC